MFVVDTNVLVYASDEDSDAHAPCAALLHQWRREAGAWYATWPIIYEYLRVVSHPRVARHPWPLVQAWRFVEALLASPGFNLLVETERHRAVAAAVISELPDLGANAVHDAHTAILMREHGIRRIYSRDRDFGRFPFLEMLDPLA